MKIGESSEFLANIVSFEEDFKTLSCEAEMQPSAKEIFFDLAMGGELVSIEGATGRYLINECGCSLSNSSEIAEVDFSLTLLREPRKTKKTKQPTVPIQFVWHDGELYRHEDFLTIVGFEATVQSCTVEQIGAVLYVRGE